MSAGKNPNRPERRRPQKKSGKTLLVVDTATRQGKRAWRVHDPDTGKTKWVGDVALLGSFEPEWRISTEKVTEGKIKDAVDSIMGLRNPIAHGENTGVTYIRIKEYYESILKLVEHVETICV